MRIASWNAEPWIWLFKFDQVVREVLNFTSPRILQVGEMTLYIGKRFNLME